MLSTLFMLLRLTVGWVHAARPLSCMDPSAHPTPLGCCSLCQPLLVSGVVLAMDSRLRSRMGASETTQSLADMCNPPQTASATLVVSASCLARVAPHVLCSVRNGTQPHALESDMHESQTVLPHPLDASSALLLRADSSYLSLCFADAPLTAAAAASSAADHGGCGRCTLLACALLQPACAAAESCDA